MMNLQITADAEGMFKRYGRLRTRKKHWREAERLKAQDIQQTMCGPKLLRQAMPSVLPKNPQRPRSAESEFGLQWERPYKNDGNVEWRETGEPERVPDKYHFNPVTVNPIQHTAVVNTKHELRRSAGGRGINGKDGNIGEIIAGSRYDERLRMVRQAAKKAAALDYIGTS